MISRKKGKPVIVDAASGEADHSNLQSPVGKIEENIKELERNQSEIPLPKVPMANSFLEFFGVWLMAGLIVAMAIIIVVLLSAWWWTMPDCQQVMRMLSSEGRAQSIEPDKFLQLWTKLEEAHTQMFTSIFQTVVLSGLVPIFTLLAGYVFGKAQAVESGRKKSESSL
jgi:ABC-type spermidine/putrescine transport system permease subunit I